MLHASRRPSGLGRCACLALALAPWPLGATPAVDGTVAAADPAAVAPASVPAGPGDAGTPDLARELTALGWTPDPSPSPECSLVQPVLPARTAVRLALNEPTGLPRPALHCPDGEAVLPIAQDPGFLERVETVPPSAAWTVRADGHVRGAAAAVHVDFPPFEPPRPRPRAPASGAGLGSRLRADAGLTPRAVLDPSMRGRASKFNKFPEPAPAPRAPELAVAAVTDGLREDALAATTDGTTWVTLALTGERASMRWSLRPERIFGGDRRLLVAPRALLPESDTVLLAVDPATLSVVSLGHPAPRDAGRWLRVTDAREREGVVEALVVADQLDPRGFSSPWGLLARRAPDGSWTFPERYFTPAPPGSWPSLEFDPKDPTRVRLVTDTQAATRPLAATAAPSAAPRP